MITVRTFERPTDVYVSGAWFDFITPHISIDEDEGHIQIFDKKKGGIVCNQGNIYLFTKVELLENLKHLEDIESSWLDENWAIIRNFQGDLNIIANDNNGTDVLDPTAIEMGEDAEPILHQISDCGPITILAKEFKVDYVPGSTIVQEMELIKDVIILSDNICPLTKQLCDDETCSPGAECNLSGLLGPGLVENDAETTEGYTSSLLQEVLDEIDVEPKIKVYTVSCEDEEPKFLADDMVAQALGHYYAQEIWDKYLHHYTDYFYQNFLMKPEEIIQMEELERGTNAEGSKGESSEWRAYIAYRRKMEEKYYPQEREYVMRINHSMYTEENGVELFKNIMYAIHCYLWNTDVSCYDIVSMLQIEEERTSKRNKSGHTWTSYELKFNFKLSK